jgi:hypothetical protein
MRWIEKQARHSQGYLADERTLIPVAILLANAVAVWLLAYLDPSRRRVFRKNGPELNTSWILHPNCPSTERISVTAIVPEASTWAMMRLAFPASALPAIGRRRASFRSLMLNSACSERPPRGGLSFLRGIAECPLHVETGQTDWVLIP